MSKNLCLLDEPAFISESQAFISYFDLLRSYLKRKSESILFEFNQLGSVMSRSGIPPEIATEIHANSLQELSREGLLIDQSETDKLLPLIEVSMAYGISFRFQLDRQKDVSHAQFLQAMEQSSDLIFITQVDGELVYSNTLCQQYFDSSKGTMFQQYPLSSCADKNEVEQMWDKLRLQNSWRGQIGLKTSRLTNIHFSVRAFPLVDEALGLHRFVFMAEDITQKKQLQKRMEQSQRLSTLGEVASGIAHEFNNILLIISGFAELIMDENETEATCDFAKEILTAVGKGQTLNQQILAFAYDRKTESRVQSLAELVGNVEVLLQTAVGRNLPIEIFGNLKQQVLISEDHLSQILTNLCLNAKHAIESTDRKGLVQITFLTDTERRLVIKVTDNGCGMSSDLKQKIFEPFFTTKDVGKGSGIGLSVVLRLVMQYQGEVSVDTLLDKGTTFTLSLPVIAGSR